MDDAEILRLIRESEKRVIKRVKEGVAYQRHAPQHRDGGSDIAGIIVEETDGTPSVKNVTRIKVSNTTLTDNGDGSVSLSVSAAGAGVSTGDNLVYIGTGADLTAGRSLAADTAHTVPVTGVDPNKVVTITAVAATTSVVGHAKFDSTNPAAIGTVTPGASGVIADRAHVHPTGAGTPSTQAFGDAAATGSGPAAAMTDHKHAMPVSYHLIAAQVDVAVASTTVPYQVTPPMPAAGTIDTVYAKLGENKTNGATSSIFDIHKIVAANFDTDGQGTTIYTTQGNRPTIANTHMGTTATAPDVTTFAAGDCFAFYTDQAGTTATVAVIGMKVHWS